MHTSLAPIRETVLRDVILLRSNESVSENFITDLANTPVAQDWVEVHANAVSNIFFVFAGSNYYPSGGWNDFIGRFYDLDSARTCVSNLYSQGYNWWQIVNSNTTTLLESGIVVTKDIKEP